MKIKKILLYRGLFTLLIAGSLASCENFFETTITIDPPPTIESLVLQGRASRGDKEIRFRITEALPILSDQNFEVPSNLEVKVLHNGVSAMIDTVWSIDISTNQSKFTHHKATLNDTLKVGDVIVITVAHPDYKAIRVTDTVPPMVEVIDPIYKKESLEDFDGRFNPIEFKINSKEPIVYIIANLSTLYPGGRCEEFDSKTGVCIKRDTVYNNNRLTFNDPDVITYSSAYIRHSETKNSKVYKGQSRSWFYGSQPFDANPKLEVFAINKKYYDFLISEKNYAESTDNPFSTAVNVITNVENGLGFFGLTNATEYYMKEM
jgi:hypothetical protein